MNDFIREFYAALKSGMDCIRTTSKHTAELDFLHTLSRVIELIFAEVRGGKKLMLIGNGASAAISSHIATDLWKNGGIRALTFNDSSVLTCVGNDYGFEHLFEKPIEMFADHGDILIAISSSGCSPNILLGVEAAIAKGCRVVTLSGFSPENPLRNKGDFNFYVPIASYGPVEILHHSVCHCIVDAIIRKQREVREKENG